MCLLAGGRPVEISLPSLNCSLHNTPAHLALPGTGFSFFVMMDSPGGQTLQQLEPLPAGGVGKRRHRERQRRAQGPQDDRMMERHGLTNASRMVYFPDLLGVLGF